MDTIENGIDSSRFAENIEVKPSFPFWRFSAAFLWIWIGNPKPNKVAMRFVNVKTIIMLPYVSGKKVLASSVQNTK